MKASEIEEGEQSLKKWRTRKYRQVRFLFLQQYYFLYKVKVNQMQSFTGVCAYLNEY